MNKSLLLSALAGLLFALPSLADHNKAVEAKLPTGKIARAEFHKGKEGQAAVLVLHGFLQTRAFPVVSSLMEAASTAGYTTLAPTLSLGISRRNKSLSCEAMHLHSLVEDADEVAYWVRWLVQKGHTRIILVGHSYGNVQLLTYMGRNPVPAVKQLLMISLTDVEMKQNAQQRAQIAQDLRDRLAKNNHALVEAEFGQCKKYVSPPAALLSYMEVSRNSILDSLKRIHVPTEVIMGGKDDRMGGDWVEKLTASGVAVRVIPGASHFFDNQYEFELQEVLLQTLQDKRPER
ncbi:MAG: alpha/beta fold hydrolase [Thiobacillus sp.]